MLEITCPECGGNPTQVEPYRLGWRGIAWVEKDLCRVCSGRGTVAPRIADAYTAGRLPLPMLYESWLKMRARRRIKEENA